MDRNQYRPIATYLPSSVVPHTGDVDRNVYCEKSGAHTASLSPTRGTWIEMRFLALVDDLVPVVPHTGDVDRNTDLYTSGSTQINVVPHTGDVDRNIGNDKLFQPAPKSSPTRGTWIEICCGSPCGKRSRSSPTRGTWIEMSLMMAASMIAACRPPHGGRG